MESAPVFTDRSAVLRKVPLLELSFCGYLFAGVFKADPRFAWFPLDITLLFAVAMLAFSVPVLARSAFVQDAGISRFLVLVFLFHAWAATSVLWGSSTVQSMSTVGLMVSNHLPAILGALAIASSPERVRKLFLVAIVFAAWVAVETIYAIAAQGLGAAFVRILSGQYQLTASTLGLGSIAALALSYFVTSRIARVSLVLTAIALIGLTPTIGGRTAVIAAAAAILLILILADTWTGGTFDRRKLARRVSLVAVFGVIVVISLVSLTEVLPVGLRRLANFIADPTAGGGRIVLWLQGIQTWLEQPFLGIGLGGFALENGYGDVQGYYPHNMVIQVAAETGLVGLALFVAMFWTPLSGLKLASTPVMRCAQFVTLCALVFYAVQTMAVGSVVNKHLYAMLTLLLCARAVMKPDSQDNRA